MSNPLLAAQSRILKICIFATGCAGIVAEFVLSTLASYLLGNPILQWTVLMSLMLFAMGLGSRVSKYLLHNLLDKFIFLEFSLSILCGISVALCYWVSTFSHNTSLLIYSLSLLIGLLIGVEIPLVTRMNESYEDLRVNISSVMEKDYYGALVGGLLFAFFALPFFGLTYTPIALGIINFMVASMLFWKFRHLIRYKKTIKISFWSITSFFLIFVFAVKPIILFSEQKKYKDRIIFEKQTAYQKIVITQWKDKYWLFINGNEQFSTFDEEKYHEPLIHPAMSLSKQKKNILILGGGEGLAAREILKYDDVEKITVVDIDPEMTELAQHHPVITKINQNSMVDIRVNIINQDAFVFVENNEEFYDVIFVDLPDPKSVHLARLYSKEFYSLCQHRLNKYGILVTQASSPIHSVKSFVCIIKTMESAGFTVLPYHNQIPTLGEWGWCLGIKNEVATYNTLKSKLTKINLAKISTKFLNKDAMISMVHFGKGILEEKDKVEVNSILDPVLVRYYKKGHGMFIN
ncbi:MAG: spermidine synthase (putrescine aminopropyltransferase) [Candidatus Scalindua rubra]|uniref:Polyamine aminopropyltransferase n=1 Tax=Candidatus Scalindua rubra TaxID=1872076 RepID=A0A1E3XC72_9BACT|nr:MAG: spermidine synthase (putrescine aminopropyltransferase) [Candidatus Scalindua rubra]